MAIYFIGVDMGATKSFAVKLSEDRLLIETAKGEGVNFQEKGLDALRAVLREIISKLRREGETCHLAVGIAGVYLKAEKEAVMKELKEFLDVDEIHVLSDAEIAHLGAHEGMPGITVVAGTGSIAVAYDGDKWYRVGGYGYLFDDPGGGYYIGKEALRSAFAFIEGWGEETELIGLIDAKRPVYEILRKFYEGEGVKEIASFAPKVVELSKRDRVARKIVRQSIVALKEMVVALHKKTGLSNVRGSGGLFSLKEYYSTLKEALKEEGLDLKPSLKYPAYGAALYSYMLWKRNRDGL